MGAGRRGGGAVPAVLRRLRAHRMVLVAVALTVTMAASFAAALSAYSSQAADAAVHSVLAPGTASTSIDFFGSDPQSTAQGVAEIRSKLSSALAGVPVTVYAAPELESINLPGSTQQHGRLATLLGTADLAAHAHLLSGAWPQPATSSTSASAPVPIALPRTAAAILGLHAGDVVRVVTAAGTPLSFAVTGVFAPNASQDPYWGLDPLAGAGEQNSGTFVTYGPFFTDPSYLAADSAVAGGALSAGQAQWVAVPDMDRLPVGSLGSSATALPAALRALGQDSALGSPASSTGLPTLLSGLASATLVAQSLVYTELLELIVVAVATLFIVVRLLTESREAEAALLWARGGTRTQLLRLRAAESALLAAPAVIVAPLVARPIANAIGRLGGGSAPRIAHLGGAAQAAAWTAVAVAAAGAIAVILAPALASTVSPVALRARRSRQAAATAIGRAGFDLALVALAAVACWQSAASDSIVGVDRSGNPDYSPVAIAAPALALAAGAVLVLRLLPLITRVADLAARRSRALTLPLALWQTGRRPLKLGGLVLLTMLSVASGVLSLSEYASAQRSAADQAAFSTGADVDVRVPNQISSQALSQLAASPGVQDVSPLYRNTYMTAGASELQATILALDPSSAARTLIMRSDLSPISLNTLMSELASQQSGLIPAVVTAPFANALDLTTGSETSVPIGNSTLKVLIVAIVPEFPTVSSPGGGVLVDLKSAHDSHDLSHADASLLVPNEVLLRDASTAPLRGLPSGSVVTYRSELQSRLRSAPLAEEPMQALLALAVATLLLALCGMAVGVIAATGERAGELALLDALGLSRRGRIRLLCTEHALVAVPGALAGIGLGLFLGRLVVPAATLTANAAKPLPPVTVLTPWTPVAIGVAIVLAVPLTVAAVAGSRRRNTASVLREGAEQ